MIREYLKKLQDLQLKAFDKGINMKITTRQGDAEGDPWIVARMNLEGCDFCNEPDEMHPDVYINYYDFNSPAGNRARFDKMLKVYEEFIEKHGK